ncbi:MAG TPA: 3-dehydroquinate synthase, partial [Desulfobaccales bacterium]|nr:3-dehydroquinate synthase [Desulfobaccales bacterium]
MIIGDNLLARLPQTLATYLADRAGYWIWDATVWRFWQNKVTDMGWPGPQSGKVLLFPASERNKRLGALEELARELARKGADRSSALIAVGGGVTGDVVGFLASIYMRGVPHFQVPTTLLAQVDSSIGGKTAVDLPEGKNLLGSFHQARAIWMDPQWLETLPSEHLRQGMAEVIKTAMIGDEILWKFLETHSGAVKRLEREALLRVISTCCLIKGRVVEADEQEAGPRRALNLGHTVGHALERLSGYEIPHGDAVAMGLVVATTLAVRLGKIPEEVLNRLEILCKIWNLPVRIPPVFSPEAVLAALKTDKKWTAGVLHF